jgi:hypothetical protein
MQYFTVVRSEMSRLGVEVPGDFDIFDRAARRFKSAYVGSASNSDGILCGVAKGG